MPCAAIPPEPLCSRVYLPDAKKHRLTQKVHHSVNSANSIMSRPPNVCQITIFVVFLICRVVEVWWLHQEKSTALALWEPVPNYSPNFR